MVKNPLVRLGMYRWFQCGFFQWFEYYFKAYIGGSRGHIYQNITGGGFWFIVVDLLVRKVRGFMIQSWPLLMLEGILWKFGRNFGQPFFPLRKEEPVLELVFQRWRFFFSSFLSPKVVEIFVLNIGQLLTMRNKLLAFLWVCKSSSQESAILFWQLKSLESRSPKEWVHLPTRWGL